MDWLPLAPYRIKKKWLNRYLDKEASVRSNQVKEDITIILGERNKPSNKVNTHNYTLFTFFPKFLYIQFKQFANLLFLVLTIIQFVPGLSPFGKQSTLVPLVFIMSCSAIRELYEDIYRRIRDRRINYQPVWAHCEEGWKMIKWCKLHVGQMVCVKSGDQIPADLLLLSSAEPGGVAYIETANLDGESSLKVRQSILQTVDYVTDSAISDFWSRGGRVVCEAPNKNILEFQGYLEATLPTQPTNCISTRSKRNLVAPSPMQNMKVPLSAGQLLLRGARLKNTDFVYGLVIYSGKHTKLMQNNIRKKMKSSLLIHLTNSIMCTQFGLCVLLSLFVAVLQRFAPPIEFLTATFGVVEEHSLMFIFLGCLVLFNGFVPISLYVTLEVVQIVQGMFINRDIEMLDKNDKGADVKMFSLNSELGQVSYIMSDKTGTLTQNCMRFRQCSVGGVKYANKKGQRDTNFSALKLLEHMESNERKNADLIRDFLIACAICHTVTPDKHNTEGKRMYHATSPDESALVSFACDAGFVFAKREAKLITVQLKGEELVYELLALIEFTSERKRMSVVVKDPMGRRKLYTKGADMMILERLDANLPTSLKRTKSHLHQFAIGGFRTLCFGSRFLSETEWERWEAGFKAASCATSDRVGKIGKVAELIEKDLQLVGVSAIEDKLQEDVPESIQKLMRAGIRLWVLTGDKLETAVNIGHSCRLLHPKVPMLVLTSPNEAEAKEDLARYIESVGETRLRTRDQELALVVDATCLDLLLSDDMQLDFVRLALCCSTVICCRCTPIQKAAVTRLVRENVSGTVLAIGDGANDVAMIQEADVGIGIAGEEGMQASVVADYAISQFKHLNRLLFVHGTLSLFRTSKCILYSLYKNVLETLCLAMFTFRNGHSDQPIAEQWTVVRYNVLFTSFTALIIGVMDRPTLIEHLPKYPQIYKLYQETLGVKGQFSWLAVGVLHAFILFIVSVCNWNHGAPLEMEGGRDGTLWVFGSVLYAAMITISNMKALLETNSITMPAIGGLVFSLFLFFLALLWDSYLFSIPGHTAHTADIIWQYPFPNFLLFIILAVVMCMGPDVVAVVIRRSLHENETDQIIGRLALQNRNFDKLYMPIFKICDLVGVNRRQLDTGKNGFAFAQDDGLAITQNELINGESSETGGTPVPKRTTQTASYSKSQETMERSMEDRTVETSVEQSISK